MKLLLRVDGWEALLTLAFVFVIGLTVGFLLARRK